MGRHRHETSTPIFLMISSDALLLMLALGIQRLGDGLGLMTDEST